MPLVKIALRSGRSAEYLRAVGCSVHRAMVETIHVPEADKFQIITDHSATGLVYHPTFLDIHRTDEIVVVQIYLGAGRTIEQKQTLYARMVELLKDDPGIAPAKCLHQSGGDAEGELVVGQGRGHLRDVTILQVSGGAPKALNHVWSVTFVQADGVLLARLEDDAERRRVLQRQIL